MIVITVTGVCNEILSSLVERNETLGDVLFSQRQTRRALRDYGLMSCRNICETHKRELKS
jgi:hypothetical protein